MALAVCGSRAHPWADFCRFLPRLDGGCFELFLREWRQEFPSGSWAVVLDNSGAHTSGHVRGPEGLTPVYLPPYSPELTPGNDGSKHCERRSQIRSTIIWMPWKHRSPRRSARTGSTP
jgi:transposase